MSTKNVTPQHSIKYNDYLQLVSINCSLPRCPEKFISVETPEGAGLRVTTGKFSVKYLLELPWPEGVVVYKDTLRWNFNGNLLRISAKAHKVGETFRDKNGIPAQIV